MVKTNTPSLRFPGFEEEWKRKRIGDISKVKNGFAFKGEFFAERGPYIVLTPGNFDVEGGFRYQGSKEKYYTSSDFSDSYILKKGDLLTAMTEQAVGLIGSGLIVPKSGLFLHNQRLGLFEVGKKVLRQFLFHFMKTHSLRLKFSKSAAGTKVRHTSVKLIEGIGLSLPSLPEQQKIAAFLSSVDQKIEQLSQKKALLEQYKRGMMQQLFSQTLRFKKTDGIDYPDWEEKRLGEVGSFKKGKGISKNDITEEGATECIRYGELYTDYSETISHVNSKTNLPTSELVLSKKNDVIIPASGETQIDIATAACVQKEGVALGGDLNIIRTDLDGVFLSYYLNSAKKIDIARIAQGSSVVHLYPDQLSKIQFNIPLLEEQTRIASFLSAIDQKLDQLEQQLEKHRAFKKGLLQQMFV